MNDAPVKQARNKRLLLLVVFLLVTFSLCYLSYVIGRTGTGIPYSGKIVDTITLSPGDGSSHKYLFNIVGYVRYDDGTPYQNGTVELRSEVLNATTDENGWFEFKNVSEGEHTISVLQNGIVIASCTITVERVSFVVSAEITKIGADSYRILVPIETIAVNLHLVLESDTLRLAEDTVTEPQITVTDDILPSQIWMQTTSVDIFAERPGNSGVSTINGANVIAPGSNGKYVFKVENPEKYPVKYTVTLIETDEHNPELPMKYRLMQGVSGSGYVGGNEWKVAADISSASVSLAPGEHSYYTLEWKWDSTDDSTDTEIGMQGGNPVYILEIVINAQY